MRLSAVAFFMILTTVFLSGCGKQEMASVEDHGDNFYSRHGVLSLSSHAAPVMAAPVAPMTNPTIVSHAAPAAEVAPAPAKLAAVEAPVARRIGSWQWPVNGQVTETFGQKSDGVANEGIVIAAAEGTPIHAAQAGEVAFVGKDTKTYGNIVILRHADGDMTAYSHARDINVKKGERVAAGGVIGTVGQSGSAKAPQLHFALRENGTSIDPLTKLPHQIASN